MQSHYKLSMVTARTDFGKTTQRPFHNIIQKIKNTKTNRLPVQRSGNTLRLINIVTLN